jgi:hypothetical protein
MKLENRATTWPQLYIAGRLRAHLQIRAVTELALASPAGVATLSSIKARFAGHE